MSITITIPQAKELLAAMDLALGAAGQMADEQQDKHMLDAAETISAAITMLGQWIEHPPEPCAYTDAIGQAGEHYHQQFQHAHPLPARWRWSELWDRMNAAAPGVVIPSEGGTK